jgi:hypothetical protein
LDQQQGLVPVDWLLVQPLVLHQVLLLHHSTLEL